MVKYIIQIDTTSQNGIQIDFDPNNYILSSFFRYLQTSQFPHFLSELSEDRNFGVENAWFIFCEQMDWEDKSNFHKEFGREIQEDEIEIQIYDGERKYSVLKKNDFKQIFYDYSQKLLEVYQSDTALPETWKNEMIISLEKLKLNINNESLT